MANDVYTRSVTEVLTLVRSHSELVRKTKRKALISRLVRSGYWLLGVGTVLILLGIPIKLIYGNIEPTTKLLISLLVISGQVAIIVGLGLMLFDSVRTIKPPFAEHADRIIDSLPSESRLLSDLQKFDVHSLRFAVRRLRMESTMVTARLHMIGGESGLKTSMIGVAILAYALINQYSQFDLSHLDFADTAYLGCALLLGLSIGGWMVKYGSARADFFCELINMAIELKEQGGSYKEEKG